jgi:hypothetical protein
MTIRRQVAPASFIRVPHEIQTVTAAIRRSELPGNSRPISSAAVRR